RDFHVTGVQTCALPICFQQEFVAAVDLAVGSIAHDYRLPLPRSLTDYAKTAYCQTMPQIEKLLTNRTRTRAQFGMLAAAIDQERSEERRVGKECRCRRV